MSISIRTIAMRSATPSTSFVRQGRRSLLSSCAIAASLAALTVGGPTQAQVQGTGIVFDGAATITGPGTGAPANTTQVTTTTNQTIINWTPTDTAATGSPIDFLPAGNSLEFYGTGQYIVLNRFISAGGTPLSRQIALNGTVNSFDGTPSAPSGNTQGGAIWFYNAGGILIGAGAAIDVGSLVLTSNDIDTSGGLLGPGGTIRFRGSAAGTSSIDIAQNSAISASNGNPGNSYVALVAPRINQAGLLNVDGSAALVAAEQADIRINGGLFDINVLVGAEGGNAIDHSGITTGPAHQQDDVDNSRIYLVAIPKNDAVTMLVSGQIGYQDALVAQTDPNGAVRLSAGFNITNGEIDGAPVNATPANIRLDDTIILSNVMAHASGDLNAGPVTAIPVPSPGNEGPFPPHLGRLTVQGDASFIGDTSASLTVIAGAVADVSGNLTVASRGNGSAPGAATIDIDGGQLTVSGNLSVVAGGQQLADGSSEGGDASLSITGGQVVVSGDVLVTADATGGIGATGLGASGTGGSASITIGDLGASLTATNIMARANGYGGGTFIGQSGMTEAVDQGGSAFGGDATITIQNGASLTANNALNAIADGFGATGNIQSGMGTGGNATLSIEGDSSAISTPLTTITANGEGGGNLTQSSPVPLLTANGGDGIGGDALLRVTAGSSDTILLGAVGVTAEARGGSADGTGGMGGNALGGRATVTAGDGGTTNMASLLVDASAQSGGGVSPDGSFTTGNAVGGAANVNVANGSMLVSGSNISLYTDGYAASGENVGSGRGGSIGVTANSGGTISASGVIFASANGNRTGFSFPSNTGSGSGGDIDLIAGGGAIIADYYSVSARGDAMNTLGASGEARGGMVDILATDSGLIIASNPDQRSEIDVGASTGVSAQGANATGGAIQIIADGGGIDFAGSLNLGAGGVSGGDDSFAASNVALGLGGSILVRLTDNSNGLSAINVSDLNAGTDGSSAVNVESGPGLGGAGAANGTGGTMTFDIQGGTFSANSIYATADGYGGNVGLNSGTGQGGTATYRQTGGNVTIGDLLVTADGVGGFAFDTSGTGIGGTATIDLVDGFLTVGDLRNSASGYGGSGAEADDSDPANIVAAGNGGTGLGGTATINLTNAAIINAGTVRAEAVGVGGDGGVFYSYNDSFADAGDGGNGIGGNATINLVSGTLTTGDLTADASGYGGFGGSLFNSSSSGTPSGASTGGNGGNGEGGTASIDFHTAILASGAVSSLSQGHGGDGGFSLVGGSGGNGTGGLAQVVVTDFDVGTFLATVDTTATGGNGSYGNDGAGGDGGSAIGGIARVQADGIHGAITVSQANFITGATGGTGGDAFQAFGSIPSVGAPGGNGGSATGGTAEVIANDGATISLAPDDTGASIFTGGGTGGDGGRGADNNGAIGLTGGDGGIGGDGIGGTIHMLANGGTIRSNGSSVDIRVSGISGSGGAGGAGQLANGACCTNGIDRGGMVILESTAGLSGPGLLSFGDTSIAADGSVAGRIEIRTDSNIGMSTLTAQALGSADPTNNDTDIARQGIFLAPTSGTIRVDGDASLTTGGSIGVYAQSGGQVDIGSDLTVDASDQIDIRHDFREGTAPTIMSGGPASFTAFNSIRSAPASLIGTSDSLLMNVSGFNSAIDVDSLDAAGSTRLFADNGRINVYGASTSGDDLTAIASGEVAINDALAGDDMAISGGNLTLGTLATAATGIDAESDGSNIVLQSSGSATVAHAEANNDFFANVGSFSTGLNSIITGGDIDITAAGAVDLGNSDAGGYVAVTGQSIAFNSIAAGSGVDLFASGMAPGAEGISGSDIFAVDTIYLNGSVIGITGTVQGNYSLFANAYVGNLAIANAEVAGDIALLSAANLTGRFSGGGNINLGADGNIDAQGNAIGGFVDNGGPPKEGYIFVDAGGDAALTDSSAATIVAVRSGGDARVTNTSADEDLFVFSGATASLTNVSAGDDVYADAPNGITANGVLTTGAGPDGRTVVLQSGSSSPVGLLSIQSAAADLSNVTLNTGAGAINAADIDAFGDVSMTATGTVSTTGLVQSGLATTISGSALDLESVTAGTDIILSAATGGVSVTGALTAGHDLTIAAPGNIDVAELDAGDDIRIDADGAIQIAAAYSRGTGFDNEGDGSNIVISGGITNVDHAESDNDFVANVASFSTGLNSLIAGGDINIATAGFADLGNSTAGGNIDIQAQSIAFNTLDAGTIVTLDAAGTASGNEGIDGTAILAGGDVNLFGNSIAVNMVDADGSLLAFATGGPLAIEQSAVGGGIDASAPGDLTGNYRAQGDIYLSSGSNIVASADAAGFGSSSSGIPVAANIFVDAAGNVELSNSNATGMFGVNAGGSASITNASAGEDMLVLAGTTARLSRISVGDDLAVVAAGTVMVAGATATGLGSDGFAIDYIPFDGFAIVQRANGASLDGADIDLRSTAASVFAAGLSAGDDIALSAATTLSVSGATTLGIGQTGTGSIIKTQSGDATFAGLTAFDDIEIASGGAVGLTGPAVAGRDIGIDAVTVNVAALTDPTGNLFDTIVAGRNLTVSTDNNITAGAIQAGGNLTLLAGTTINLQRARTGTGTLTLDASDGIDGNEVASGGAANFASIGGAIAISSLTSTGPVTANGDSIVIGAGGGSLFFSQLNTDVGDATVTNTGNLTVASSTVAGRAILRSTNAGLDISGLSAADIQLASGDAMTLGTVTASNSLLGQAGGVLTVNGVVTGRDMALGSADIVVAANGRIGTGGSTATLDIRNTSLTRQTFIGGTGTRSGYHLDADEMTRLFATNIQLFAPSVGINGGGFVAAAPGGLPIGSVGSSAQPDLIIDAFTLAAGTATSNLGANGSLTLATPGKARVTGDVRLTGMSDTNALNITADQALEVILGAGSIRLTGSGAALGGRLNLQSDDVIVATPSAISDVGSATTTDAISNRLAKNDGILIDGGALAAAGVDVSVVGSFYVQNSGAGTSFVDRRGLTFGQLGLNVNTEAPDTRIVINGVHLGPSGSVTGLDAIPLLTINGSAVGSSASSGSSFDFDPRSTMNGCIIVGAASCTFQEIGNSFPVQDVVNDLEDGEDGSDESKSVGIPLPLITIRDVDPLTGEPLLDDPVTGAGNDDLWTPPTN